MTYVLKAVRFRHNVAYNDKGQPTEVKIYRQGDVVDDLPHEHLERLFEAGAVEHVDEEEVDDVTEVVVEDEAGGDAAAAEPESTPDAPGPVERPRNTAAKKAWVDYAVTVKGWARDKAEALDRAELIEALG